MSTSLAFLTFLQDGPTPLAVVDKAGVVTLVSQAFENATGHSAGDPAPDWMTESDSRSRRVTLGDRSFDTWSKKLSDGVMVVLVELTDVRSAEDRLFEQQVHLHKVYAQMAVRDRWLDRAMGRIARGDTLSETVEKRVKEQERQKEIAALLSRHLPRETAESIASRSHPELEPHKRVLTVLFADMLRIDELVAEMEAEEFLDFLEEYRTGMSRIIFEAGGAIDRIVTVRVKAFFGDPIPHQDHAARAVRAALHMRSYLRDMRPRWFPTASDADLQLGLHTGYATVGTVGPEPLSEYTAFGKNISLAKAIQRSAKPGQLLLSGRTYDAVRGAFYTEAMEIQLPSTGRELKVYEVTGEKTPVSPPAIVSTGWVSVPGNRRLGPYVVIEKIGEGGMAEVYKGLDEGLNRHVAIKVLSARQAEDEKFVSRFQREARGLAKLNSPYVAQIYYIGIGAKPPFFAMEYVDGKTLRQIIQKEGPVPIRQALTCLTQLATGLRAAAEHGIIHRDIKPDNIMLDSKGTAKLMDFGLVKRADDESGVTAHGIIIGTPRYMSPEQARCESVDLRSDIYSLGATFYHMIVGKAPFDGDSALAIMRKHEVAPLPPLSSLPRQVTPAIYELLRFMMAKDPNDRFQDYDRLLSAVAAC